jgi:hypothetical protein
MDTVNRQGPGQMRPGDQLDAVPAAQPRLGDENGPVATSDPPIDSRVRVLDDPAGDLDDDQTTSGRNDP